MSAATQIKRWRDHPASMVRELFGVEPDHWQEAVLEKFPTHPRQSMAACKGPGKAQPKETVIPTPSGDRVFGDLRPGDMVFGAHGMPVRVKSVHDRGVLPVFRVSFDDRSSTLACGEHLWKVRGRTERRHDTWSVLTTQQVIDRGVREKNGKWSGRHFEIPRQQPVSMPAADLPLDPYALGIWLGDGIRLKPAYATKLTHEISIEIKRRGLRISEPRTNIVWMYRQSAPLRSLGLLPLYSYERFVPAIYKMGSEDQRRDVLMGLMDTDGCIGTDGHMEFSSTSKHLAEDIIWLARSLGGVAYLKPTPSEGIVKGRDCYRVTLCLPFNPFRMPEKAARWKDPQRYPSTIRYMTRKIDAIEPEGEADCMCIEVDHPDGLYLTNDFIVTHNTTILAWLCWNFLLTRPHPKIPAVSISADNLADNLWPEMSKWQQKSELLKAKFTWTKTRIYCNDHPETWFMVARAFPKAADPTQQADTLAGFHADYIMFVLDEAGGIPRAVLATAEAAESACIECHLLMAGNPTQLDGALYQACVTDAKLWDVTEITGDPNDPMRSPRVSVEWAQQQIAKYGRDNPWVMINVLGKFPPSSLNALISEEEIRAAMARMYRRDQIGLAARILGVDIADFGDDSSVICRRHGIQVMGFEERRNLNSIEGAGWVNRAWNDFEADACFLDGTGGWGTGWRDNLRAVHRAPISVGFAEQAHNPAAFWNKRAEMYWDAAHWIRDGGALPVNTPPEFIRAMSETTYTYRGDKLILEPKEDIKARLGFSPDHADSFVLTHAEPVTPQRRPAGPARHSVDYNPYGSLASAVKDSYNPYGGR